MDQITRKIMCDVPNCESSVTITNEGKNIFLKIEGWKVITIDSFSILRNKKQIYLCPSHYKELDLFGIDLPI
jgi:hypothetical protein